MAIRAEYAMPCEESELSLKERVRLLEELTQYLSRICQSLAHRLFRVDGEEVKE